MDCRETQTLLTAFHDGELSDADRTRVDDHLKSCLECGRRLAELARADKVAGVPDPGPGYWDRFNARVADRIEREEDGRRAPVLRPKQGWMRQQLRFLIPASAAAALVVAVVWYGGHGPVAPKPGFPPAVSVGDRSAPDSAGSRVAESEMKPPAAKKTGDAAGSGRPPAEGIRTAAIPAAPPDTVATDRFPTVAREERDRLVARSLSEEKERMLRDRAAEPEGVDALSVPPLPGDRPATAEAAPAAAKPKQAASAESTSGIRIGKDQIASEAPAAMSAGKTRAKAIPTPPSSDSARAASPCETAQSLASQGLFREAEAAQRECLARDSSLPSQEKGLIFLAELLDRQARFADADAVLAEVHRQFPRSLPLDRYRQQRPAVQKQQMPVPVTR